MCEAKEYPRQNNIIQLMGEDFKKPNIKKKKSLVKRINIAFDGQEKAELKSTL